MISGDAVSLPSFFDAALIINLAERTDRRKLAENEFKKAGWNDYQFFPASRFEDAAGFKFASWRGCFYSHLGCFRIAQKQKLKNILIFEDDIALSSSIQQLTPTMIEDIRKLEWDFLFFGHEQTGDIPRATRRTGRVDFEICDIQIQTTHFYAVNTRIISRLIAHFEKLANGVPGDNEFGPMPADGALNTFRRQNKDVITYIAKPKLGWQRPSRSDIAPGRLDSVSSLRPIIDYARKFKHFLSRCLNGF
jgi:glycosyl transferase family 25